MKLAGARREAVPTREYRARRTPADRASDITPEGWPELRAATTGHAELGDYDVLGLLAAGGMGGVYHAEERATGMRVAIKVLDPDFAGHEAVVKRFFREQVVSRRIHHRGVVRIPYGGCTASGLPYLVMELVDGDNLAEICSRGRLEVPTIATIGRQIAEAMTAVHASGVVHCDLKPHNVIAQYRPGETGGVSIKVIDFGAARFVGDDGPAGTIVGTPEYMPPEQWLGITHPRSDVYSLGCLLYDLITGEVPFAGTSDDLLAAHREQTPRRVSSRRAGLSPQLDDVILGMLAKPVAARPPMEAVVRELEHLEASLAPARPPRAITE